MGVFLVPGKVPTEKKRLKKKESKSRASEEIERGPESEHGGGFTFGGRRKEPEVVKKKSFFCIS